MFDPQPTYIGVLFGCFGRKVDGPGLPGGLIIYQGHLFAPQKTPTATYRSSVQAMEQEAAQAEEAEMRASQIGSGGRSEKSRSYNFKESKGQGEGGWCGLCLGKVAK